MKTHAALCCFLFIGLALQSSPAKAQTNTFPSSGNVGIGTTSPGSPLTIVTTSDPAAAINHTGTSGNASFSLQQDGTVEAFMWWDRVNSRLNLGTPTTNPTMTLVTNGSVGIGTASPSNLLDVNGNADFLGGKYTLSTINDGGGILINVADLVSGSASGGASIDFATSTGGAGGGFDFDDLSNSNGAGLIFQSFSSSFPIYFRYAPGGVTSYNFLTLNPTNHTSSFTGTVGIGTATPAVSLDLSQETDALALPAGTTAQRPSAVNGMIRYNSSTSALEAYVNGAWIAVGGSPGSATSSAGQLQCSGANCSNSTGSGTIQYCPYKGNIKTTASQGNYTIPSACLSATLTSMYVGGTASSSVAASTLYYLYLWNTSGTWVLDAETTGHATDSSSGIEIMNGDNTKTLVGMIHADASKHVMTGGQTSSAGDTDTVATWDNRRPTRTLCQFIGGRSVNSTFAAEINSENRCYFMSWGDAAIFGSTQMVTQTLSGTTGNVTTQLYLESSTDETNTTITPSGTGGSYYVPALQLGITAYPTEGYHYTELFGAVASSSGTATYPALEHTSVYSVQ